MRNCHPQTRSKSAWTVACSGDCCPASLTTTTGHCPPSATAAGCAGAVAPVEGSLIVAAAAGAADADAGADVAVVGDDGWG